ncbi:MAG: LD-carboxypeptidase [Defluviitaleaceae bacterium]|nr:LD-carboxypeptidase [Defluviitaleaceae bacterium]
MRKPNPLREGDTIAITAASGPVNPEKLSAGIKILEGMGLRVHVTESCYASHEYLAGPDTLRLRDLHNAFANKNIKGILMARGGYGASRLLPHLNYSMIRRNPKIFAGYSDVTALHIVLNQFCNLITYHAPMPGADLPNADEITLKSFMQMLMIESEGNKAEREIDHERHKKTRKFSCFSWLKKSAFSIHILEIVQKGNSTGILTGGNLTLIASLIGTPFEIETRGRILFLEETQEQPYRVDRMILQLKLAGKLENAAGFILGDFSPENLETIKLAISELLIPEGKPIIAGLPCGHTMPNITLPLGKTVKISTESLYPIQIYARS